MNLKKKIINQLKNDCILCGKCISECKIAGYTSCENEKPREIQKEIIKYLDKEFFTGVVRKKIYSCMECYYCTNIKCPAGIDIMSVNRVLKSVDNTNPLYFNYSDYEEIRKKAEIKCSDIDTEKLFSEKHDRSEILFFPGCNVYSQPYLLMKALLVMEIIGPFSFLPGLDNCCGANYLFTGQLNEGLDKGNALIQKISEFSPEKVVLWCPTCICNFIHMSDEYDKYDFEFLTFGQYIEENMDKLKFNSTKEKTITLHEACKTSYMNIDTDSVRNIIKMMPGTRLIEMRHNRENTMCCGSGNTIFSEIHTERLNEACETEAESLIDVCHYCHQVFRDTNSSLEIMNYVDLVIDNLIFD